MDQRKPSKHVVVVFNPNLDPSVAEALKAEQLKNPKVCAVAASGSYGLVPTPKGTFFLDADGVGPSDPVTEVPVDFYRSIKEDNGKTSMECIPFATVMFSVEECLRLKVAEKTLDQFVHVFGRRNENNYNDWETALDEANPTASGQPATQ